MNARNLLWGARTLLRNPISFVRARWFRIGLRRRMRGRHPRILLRRYSGGGDVVWTLPAVRALREKHPNAYLVYETAIGFVPLVQNSGCADEVVATAEPSAFPLAGQREFDLVIRPELPDEIGLPPSQLHLGDDFIAALGVATEDRQPRIHVPDDWREFARRRLGEADVSDGLTIAIHTGPSWPVREWGKAGWEALVQELKRIYGAHVVQIGVDQPPKFALRVDGAIDLVRDGNIMESTSLIAHADYFIGIDSALLHIAGAVGTPLLGIFGPVRADFRLPPITPCESVAGDVPCLGCHHRFPSEHWRTNCLYDIRCMTTLSAKEVLAAFARLVAKAPR
jgi:ADP-heptose:LPS heptosyltransferase